MAVSKQTLLDNVETALNARLNGGGVQSYMIGGRNLMYVSISELTKLRDQLRREIAQTTAGATTNYASFEDAS